MKLKPARIAAALLLACASVMAPALRASEAQDNSKYPEEIRGYKVELRKVDLKDEGDKELVTFGDPRIVSVTPLGITLDVPLTIAPVKQGGKVDFLSFEDIVINGTPARFDDYEEPFDLPNKKPLTLKRDLRFFVNSPRTILGVIDELRNPKEEWKVTGRVFVFGRFKKFIMKFKRVVPIDLDFTMRNPFRS